MERNEIAKQLVETLMNDTAESEIRKMIKNNTIPFKHKEINYRVRKATWEEQETMNKTRLRKFNTLLDDDVYLFRDQLIEKYQKKGVDIKKMDIRVDTISGMVNSLRIKATESGNKSAKEAMAKQIEDLMQEQALIIMKKNDLLSYSLEDALVFYMNGYLAFTVLEKEVKIEKEKPKWVKVFNKYEDFAKCKDTILINKTLQYLDFLVYYEQK